MPRINIAVRHREAASATASIEVAPDSRINCGHYFWPPSSSGGKLVNLCNIERSMKLATFNVNGVNGRLPVLLGWLAKSEPDVVCLQELKAPDEKFPVAAIEEAGWNCEGKMWGGEQWFTDWSYASACLGVGAFSHWSLKPSVGRAPPRRVAPSTPRICSRGRRGDRGSMSRSGRCFLPT